jgi:CheY-like chemotaxis protein/HPt (histidine-containing phosphotransfer) domain-containing protein
LRSLAVRAHRKGLELVCHIPDSVPVSLIGDPLRFRQVLINLVGNAIKFTDDGEIVVRVSVEDRTATDVLLHVSVTDTGIGIPYDRQGTIFEAFTQADGSMTRRYEGTGLGLAISGQLVEMMDGRIWVESEPGRGSTFHFRARLGLDAASDAPGVAVARAAMRGVPALVVDDNATNRRVLGELLRTWQMRVTVAADGGEALAALRQAAREARPFAVAILDGQMPMNGVTLAARIRGDDELRDTALILLTSSDRAADPARYAELGIAAYLTKPVVVPEDLLRCIQTALSAGRVSDGAPAAAIDSPAPRPGGLRILVADDNGVNCTVVKHLLEKHGHSVLAVGDGRQVLDAIERDRFDLVLMDLQMPEMDGFEATRAIRATDDERGVRLPVVALTAHAMKGDRERCLAAGMDGYVSKPVQAPELLAAIRNVTRGPGAPPAPEAEERVTLRDMGDDPERLLDLVAFLQNDNRRLLQEIRDGIARGEARAVERAAHRLKGSLGLVGTAAGDAAGVAAATLEAMCRAGDLHAAGQVLRDLEGKVAKVGSELERLVDEATLS